MSDLPGKYEIPLDQIEAVVSFINIIKDGIENHPSMRTYELFNCGCMGPLPECRCMKRSRLVNEFLESYKKRAERNE